MMECDWVGGGSLAMKHGAAVTRTCKRVGAVDGDQDWSQETWIPSLLGNRSTNPLAITDIHAYRPAKKAIGTSPCGPVVKNLPSNAGDTGSIPCRGTKIPHATGQLSLRATMETQHSQKKPKLLATSIFLENVLSASGSDYTLSHSLYILLLFIF